MPATIQHLRAPNDRNGNPRRVWMVYVPGSKPLALDEGYAGRPYQADPKSYIDTPQELPRLDITPRQYRELLRDYGPVSK